MPHIRVAPDTSTVSDTATTDRAPRGRGPTVNRVILVGRPTKDPELRYTESGVPVVSMRVVTNERPEPEFYDVVAWRRLAETCAQYLTKGLLVYLECRLHGRSWTGGDGIKRQAVEIVADTLQMLSSQATAAE